MFTHYPIQELTQGDNIFYVDELCTIDKTTFHQNEKFFISYTSHYFDRIQV